MNDATKTIAAIVLAAGLCAGAYVTAPKPVVNTTFSDQGELFFPDFKDPGAAKSLEVIAYDEPTASLNPFKVKFDGKRWVIPSHHNYPADAEQNMAAAASSFIGLAKDSVVSDKASDHQAFGVLAPDDDKAPLSGRGTRVTIQGAGGSVLGDLIIGKPVEKGAVGGMVYARVPGKNRVYAVHFSKKITTKFADWVQTDVLKAASASFTSLYEDRYKIDELAGTKVQGDILTIKKADPSTVPPPPANPDPNAPPPAPPRWTFTCEPGGGPKDGEKVNETRVDEAFNTLRSLRIVGVRPKPEKLVSYFSGEGKVQLNTLDALGLQSCGFFATKDGRFAANEGEVIARCEDGVSYHLYFGNVIVAEGEALSAGSDDSAAAKDAKTAPDAGKDGAKDAKNPKGTEGRYMFATAAFDESLLGPAPTPPTAPKAPEGYVEPKPDEKKPDAPAPAADAPKPEPAKDSPEVEAYKKAKEEYTKALGEYNQKAASRTSMIEAGKKHADQLKKAFAGWYYVIDNPTFNKIRPTRSELIMAPTPPTPAAAPDGTAPGMPAPGMPAPVMPAPTGAPHAP